MAIGFSSVTLMGNLTRDPELRYTPGGDAVCDITLAISSGKKGSEKTAFVECVVWGKTAEAVSGFFRKGKPILVQGELQQDEWTDKETGKKRTKLKVQVRQFSFLPRNGGGDDTNNAKPQSPASSTRQSQPKEDDDFGNDEIPF